MNASQHAADRSASQLNRRNGERQQLCGLFDCLDLILAQSGKSAG
jgi:hypothetical protein